MSSFAFQASTWIPTRKVIGPFLTYPPWDLVSEKLVFGHRKRQIRLDSQPKHTSFHHRLVPCGRGFSNIMYFVFFSSIGRHVSLTHTHIPSFSHKHLHTHSLTTLNGVTWRISFESKSSRKTIWTVAIEPYDNASYVPRGIGNTQQIIHPSDAEEQEVRELWGRWGKCNHNNPWGPSNTELSL